MGCEMKDYKRLTDREKIIGIIDKWAKQAVITKINGASVYDQNNATELTNALIAAGIGDVSCLREHRVIAEYSLVPDDDSSYIIPNVPLRVTQLYSGEEVEKIAKERKELKDELRSKVEYIQEQDEVIKEYKHRAEVAEKALKIVCRMQENLNILVDGKPWTKEEIYNRYIQQAEKELQEEM